ncbi:MAG: type II secretion system protein GspE, partial [Xanthomonadales bacterium]|nr:type II secretion system protein GspE [Xanthomonadales bacterium]
MDALESASPDASQEDFDARLIQHLVTQGRLKESDVRKAERLVEESGDNPVGLMIRLGLMSERDAAEAMAQLLDVPLVGTKQYPEVPPSGIELPLRFLREQHVVPIAESEDAVTVVMADPRDQFAIDGIRMAAGKDVEVRVGVQSEIDDVVERFYGG